MIQTAPHVADMARVISLAVAPVFLLTGVMALVNVLAVRLGRIIDRARQLEVLLTVPKEMQPPKLHDDLKALRRRARYVNNGITLSVASALLVCVVIAVLFVGSLINVDVASSVATLFIISMIALIGALLFFLREILIATATVKIGPV